MAENNTHRQGVDIEWKVDMVPSPTDHLSCLPLEFLDLIFGFVSCFGVVQDLAS